MTLKVSRAGMAQTPTGTRDYAPKDMAIRRSVVEAVENVYRAWGYPPLQTPAMEYLDVLTTDHGETARELFQVSIRSRNGGTGGRQQGLRYDHTVPLARHVAQNRESLPIPFRRYAIGPVWRPDKPQRGRYREFWQADIDIVGMTSDLADAEIIGVLDAVVRSLEISDYEILVSDRRLHDAIADALDITNPSVAEEVFRAWDKLDKLDRPHIEKILAAATTDDIARDVLDLTYSFLVPLGGTNHDKLNAISERLASPRINAAVLQVRRLLNLASETGVRTDRLNFQPTLARGFGYYTGPIFEVRSRRSSIGSFAGGGRYDHLIQTLGGPDLPAVGASFGIERLIDVLGAMNITNVTRSSPADILLALVDPMDTDLGLWASHLASTCRESGFATDTYLGTRRLGHQLRYAEELGIPVVLIVGDDERRKGVVNVRRIVKSYDGNAQEFQQEVAEDQLPVILTELLRR
jgi:histidyl-tRNA synthetase